jgi:hypothetical protein
MKKQLGMGLQYALHILHLHRKYGRKKSILVKRVVVLLAK